MKKNLRLKTETLRHLTLPDLGRVVGGSYAGCPATIGAACVTVYACTAACTGGGGGSGTGPTNTVSVKCVTQ